MIDISFSIYVFPHSVPTFAKLAGVSRNEYGKRDNLCLFRHISVIFHLWARHIPPLDDPFDVGTRRTNIGDIAPAGD